MKKLVFAVMPLLLGTHAQGMWPPQDDLGAGAAAAAAAAPAVAAPAKTPEQIEERYRQQIVSDFFAYSQVLALTPGGILTFFKDLVVSDDHEVLLASLLGMTFETPEEEDDDEAEEDEAEKNKRFFEKARQEVLTKNLPATTYTELYTNYFNPLRGYYALWAQNFRDEELDRVFAVDLATVDELNYENRGLASVNAAVFSVFTNLRALDLSCNGIEVVRHLDCCPGLTSLDLSNNKLKIPPGLTGCSELETLYLNDNGLEAPPDLSGCPLLKRVWLQNNKLRKGPNLDRCPLLEELDLSGNNIGVAPSLRNNGRLAKLDLAGNRIGVAPNLDGCPLLEELDLSSNKLKFPPILKKNRRLRELHLQKNLLKIGPNLTNNDSLEILYIWDNQIKIFPAVQPYHIQLLQELDIRENPLLPSGNVEGRWGKLELQARFGDRVIFADDDAAGPPMGDDAAAAAAAAAAAGF